MKDYKTILEIFGEIISTDCFDPNYGNLTSLKEKKDPPEIFKDYVNLFSNMSNKDFEVLKKYQKETIEGVLHDFMRVFEENEQFKLIYEEDGTQVNLAKISEMLRSEHLGEDGWIERFSKELNK